MLANPRSDPRKLGLHMIVFHVIVVCLTITLVGLISNCNIIKLYLIDSLSVMPVSETKFPVDKRFYICTALFKMSSSLSAEAAKGCAKCRLSIYFEFSSILKVAYGSVVVRYIGHSSGWNDCAVSGKWPFCKVFASVPCCVW